MSTDIHTLTGESQRLFWNAWNQQREDQLGQVSLDQAALTEQWLAARVEKDLRILQPGWDAWVKSREDDEMRKQYALSLQAEAIANRRDREEQRQVQMLQLQLAGYQAGLFALWEVALFPPQGVAGFPVTVVVPARNSAQAMTAAKMRYPNYRVGPAAKVNRK